MGHSISHRQGNREIGRFVLEPWPAVPVPEEETPSLPVLAMPKAA